MPMLWTPNDHERMLMVIMDHFPIKMKTVVEAWTTKYPDAVAPTLRAIEQHVGKLRKKANGATGSTGGVTNSTPGTPRKVVGTNHGPKTPKGGNVKTPTTNSRRKKYALSDEDDSEPYTTPAKVESLRATRPRRSKTGKRISDVELSDEEMTPDEWQASIQRNYQEALLDHEVSQQMEEVDLTFETVPRGVVKVESADLDDEWVDVDDVSSE